MQVRSRIFLKRLTNMRRYTFHGLNLTGVGAEESA